MTSIWKTNSARVALRSIAAAESATTTANHHIPSRLSSVRHVHILLRNSIEPLSKDYAIKPPMNFGIHLVPEKTAYIVERSGKYFKTLPTGVHFLNPFLDKIAHVHKLWQELIKIPSEPAITKDKVTMFMDGSIGVKIVDPKLASYGVEGSPLYAVAPLAQTIITRELSKMTMDDAKTKWCKLNKKVLKSINVAAKSWGLECVSCWINEDGSRRLMPSFPPSKTSDAIRTAMKSRNSSRASPRNATTR